MNDFLYFNKKFNYFNDYNKDNSMKNCLCQLYLMFLMKYSVSWS